MTQLVLFGGTFDPIHHGHLIVARAVAERFGFAKVTFVPTGIPPHGLAHGAGGHKAGAPKRPGASAQQRLEMIRLAIAGESGFDVSEMELGEQTPNFTSQTLARFSAQLAAGDELYWIVGADMLADLPNWHRAREVVERATVITAVRPGWALSDRTHDSLGRVFSPAEVENIRAWITPTPLIDISSTQIRARVAESRPIRYLTPEAVVDYVENNSLYRQT